MRSMDCKMVLISLCIILLSTICEGHPLSKRTVSEVQLMHNRGEHKLLKERREWLQTKLKGIHLGPAWARGDPAWTSQLWRRKLLPKNFPNPDTLTSEEIQFTMDYLGGLLGEGLRNLKKQ